MYTMKHEYSLKEHVFRTFLVDPSLGPSEMTEKLGAKYNSVKAAYAKLCDEGMLKREGRGSYSPDVARILLNLLDRVEVLEGRER
jgi:predicted transcriptional regulator